MRKGRGAATAMVLLLAVVIFVPVLSAAVAPPAAADCTITAGETPAGGGTARLALNTDQIGNVKTIVAVAKGAGLPKAAAVIAVMTGLQESHLLNLANPAVPESLSLPHQGVGHDHDSVNVFQQRPSAGWGTPGQLMNPTYAAQQFFVALAEIPSWASMPSASAAQAVQISADGSAYAKWQPTAQTVVDALFDSTRSPSGESVTCTPGQPAATTAGGWTTPIVGSVETQPYCASNGHESCHPGVDLAAPAGTPLRAVHPGIVVFAGPASGYGDHYICTDIGGGYVACYGHASAQYVQVGQQVTAGQPLAAEGCEGLCSGPHLHFEIRTGLWGPTQDPVAFLAQRGVRVP